MALDSNVVGTVHTEVFWSMLSEESEKVFAVNFDEEATKALVEVLGSLNDPPKARLLARESVLKWVRDDFVMASAAAELGAADNLELRTTDEHFENVLLVREDAMVAVRV